MLGTCMQIEDQFLNGFTILLFFSSVVLPCGLAHNSSSLVCVYEMLQKSTENVDHQSRSVIDYYDYQLREPDLSTTGWYKFQLIIHFFSESVLCIVDVV
jgi:hypothetical protein